MKQKRNNTIIRRLRSSYLTTIVSISLVLFLLGILGLLVLNAKQLSTYVKENIGFSLYLKDNAKPIQIKKIQKEMDAMRYVKSTKYIDKDEAHKIYIEIYGEDFIDALEYNPLLASIEVKLRADYANSDSIAFIEKDFQKYSEVKEVDYQKDLVHLVNENVKKISLILFAFSILLFIISFALINNTIRLSVYSKRFIIKTMLLVGATRNFIRKPFLLTSILHGFIGALIAIGLLISVIYWAQNEMKGVISLNEIEILSVLFLGVILLGMLISLISTYFAINKYLRLKEDTLYTI